MDIAELEKILLDALEALGPINSLISRNDHGVLSVSIKSTCKEIGYIKAYVTGGDITLTCKIAHTHFELSQ